MKANNYFNNPIVEKRVPTDIYLSLVGSLYSEKKSLLFGVLGTSTAVFITAWKTGALVPYLCFILLILVGMLRWFDTVEFNKVDISSAVRSEMESWENRYTAGAALSSAIIGFWCFYGVSYNSDPAVQLIAISVTLANMIGVFGRNFGFEKLVTLQLAFTGGPMFAGLLLPGDTYFLILGLLLLPFFASAKSIADRLRNTLLAAVIGQNEVSKLANQFDTALNNMPQGLCMFDTESRLVVANERADVLLNTSLDALKGGSLQDLIANCIKNDTLSANDGRKLLKHLNDYPVGETTAPIQVKIAGSKILQFKFQRMDNGGTVAVFDDITERVAADRKIKHMARYDSLTHLPNRAYFRTLMSAALNKCDDEHDCAVLVLDIDEFKQINDTLGHPVGDELLRSVAERLKNVAGASYPVSRFGGDEFVILLPELRCDEEASALAGIVTDVLKQTFSVAGHDIIVGASIGIASTTDGTVNPDTLLRNADLALYSTKTDGKGNWRFYHSDMGIQMEARLSMESDLRRAQKNNELSMHFQPLVNVKSMKITTCEALIRWQHPAMGNIPPGTFVPIAEEMGLIVEIGDWALRESCLECAKWPDNVRVAVNLSAVQFKRGDVVASVQRALRVSRLPANRLELEITESVMLQDLEETIETLEKLHRMGVHISLDDFGTGYSSLSYLHNLPLNKVKIDRSFIIDIASNEKSFTMCKNIAEMSKQLGLLIVVEGVETEDQFVKVTTEVCVDEIQGYLFSRPLPAADILELISATSGKKITPIIDAVQTGEQ